MSKLAKLAAVVLAQTGLEDYTSNAQVGVDLNAQALATEQALGELAQGAALETEITQDLETFVNARAALEGWHDMAQRSLAKGGLRPETAEAIAFGVKTIEDAMGIEKRIMPGLEAFGGTSSMHQATEIGLEGFKDSFKKIIDGYRRAFNTLVARAQDNCASALKVGQKLVDRTDGLRKRVVALGSADGSGVEIAVRDGKLFADGAFIGTNANLMLPIVNFITDTWPKAEEQYAKDMFDAVTNGGQAPDVTAMVDKLLNTSKLFQAFPGTEQSAGQEGQDLKRSVILGGNKALFGGFTESAPPANSKDWPAVTKHLRSVILELKEVQGAKVAPNDFTAPAPTAKSLLSTLDGISKVAGVLAAYKRPNYKEQSRTLSDAWFAKAEEDDSVTLGDIYQVQGALPVLITSLARLNITGVSYHVGTVLNAMLSLAQQQVEALEKAK